MEGWGSREKVGEVGVGRGGEGGAEKCEFRKGGNVSLSDRVSLEDRAREKRR